MSDVYCCLHDSYHHYTLHCRQCMAGEDLRTDKEKQANIDSAEIYRASKIVEKFRKAESGDSNE